MLRLLNIELFKIKNSKASKVLIIMYFALLSMVALLSVIKFDIGPIQFHLAKQGIYNFPYIWHFNTYMASILKIFLLLVVVSLMISEYTNRTLKQNLIDGLSKKELILSKFYTIVLLSLASTVFIFVMSLILGLVYSDYNELSIIVTDLEFILAYFIKHVAFLTLGLFLAVLIRKSAFALGAFIVLSIVEGIFTAILRWSLKLENWDTISQFFPINSMANLIVQPIQRLDAVKTLSKQAGIDTAYDYGVGPLNVIVVIAWTSLFVYFSYKILKRRDL
ncbi:MAG: ABC transporter permease [Flavobacteriaceae bacterium]|nr:ABC transporter permease [Flavobacteriaceae bacterium]